MKTILSPLAAFLLSASLLIANPPNGTFEEIAADARQMGETDEGKAYEKRLIEVFAEPLRTALMECAKGTKPPYTVSLVIQVGADGATQHIHPAPGQAISACAARKLDHLKLPAPPKAGWMVLINIEIKG